MEKEPILGLFNNPKNRFEELQAAHQIQADIVHGVVRLAWPQGPFLFNLRSIPAETQTRAPSSRSTGS